MSRKNVSIEATHPGPAPDTQDSAVNTIDWKRIAIGLAIWAALGLAFYLLAP